MKMRHMRKTEEGSDKMKTEIDTEQEKKLRSFRIEHVDMKFGVSEICLKYISVWDLIEVCISMMPQQTPKTKSKLEPPEGAPLKKERPTITKYAPQAAVNDAVCESLKQLEIDEPDAEVTVKEMYEKLRDDGVECSKAIVRTALEMLVKTKEAIVSSADGLPMVPYRYRLNIEK